MASKKLTDEEKRVRCEYQKKWQREHKEIHNARQRDYAARHPHKNKAKHLRKRYGLTLEQFDELISTQNNLCSVCKLPLDGRIHVDHCHKTGKIRGILHANCNTLLGLANENIYTLFGAVDYLRKHFNEGTSS